MAGPDTIVIVSAGLAGAKAAESRRAWRFDGRVGLVDAEPTRPYERPPLSKGTCVDRTRWTTPQSTAPTTTPNPASHRAPRPLSRRSTRKPER